MICLAPRAREEIVRPRRLSDVVVRPLNFTVRSHLGGIRRCEESEAPSLGSISMWTLSDVFARRLRGARAATRLRSRSGRAPKQH